MRDLERRRKKREARLAAMDPDQLEQFLRRSRAMRPGTVVERARRRDDRAAREALARLNAQPAEPVNPEIAALDFQIAKLEAEIAARLKDGANE
jgi:hypothetical protein